MSPVRKPSATVLAVPLALAQFSEAEVKAAFVYNLAKFAEWPESTQSGGELRNCAGRRMPAQLLKLARRVKE